MSKKKKNRDFNFQKYPNQQHQNSLSLKVLIEGSVLQKKEYEIFLKIPINYRSSAEKLKPILYKMGQTYTKVPITTAITR